MTTNYGLSREGFTRKRLADVITSLNSRVADKLGIPIQTGSNSVFGQLHGVYAYEIADLWESLEDVYNAMYPGTATGKSLSSAAGLSGIEQIDAEKTTVMMTCIGTDGFTIPSGSQLALKSDSNNTYTVTTEGQQISLSAANTLSYTIASVAVGAEYGLQIDSVDFKHTAVTSDTVTSILVALETLIAAQRSDLTVTVTNDVLVIDSVDKTVTFSAQKYNGEISRLGSPIQFSCDTYGANTPATGDLSQMVQTYSGWTSAINEAAATVGRDAETDIQLRQRWSAGLYDRASAMTEAISAAIYANVDGVTAALCYENPEDTVDSEGRKKHSIEAVVSGGDPGAIAKQIWRTKAGGIDTNGAVAYTVYDSNSIPHIIYFNRPTEVPVWFDIVVRTNPDETWSASALGDIQAAVLTKAAELTIGNDVILQKFYATVFTATTGVGQIEIKAATGAAPASGDYSTSNISISDREVAVFASARITVTKGA